MPGSTTGSAGADRLEPLARAYRRFGDETAGTSPLQQRVAVALGGSESALRAVLEAPARRRQPAAVLAALHHLALSGAAPALAAAYAARDADAAARAALETLLEVPDAVIDLVVRRRVRTDQAGRAAVLHPMVAEAARRAGADAVGLVDVGCSAGLDLVLDRVAIRYDDGLVLGDPSSPAQLSASVVGTGSVPAHPVPEVAVRVGTDPDPVDVTDPEEARWLLACLAPEEVERAARLEAELALVAAARPVLMRGGAADVLPDALGLVPAGALPVVTTTWSLSRLHPEGRLRFLEVLVEAAARRPVAWVSAEGVGVAPEVPTLGDRRASGHSILGVVVLDASGVHAEAVGRCWSRGRLLSWVASEQQPAPVT